MTSLLPVLLLLLSFLLKLAIEREVDLPKTLRSIVELPADVMFLSSSLIIAYVLANKDYVVRGLLGFIACIITSVIVVILWRKSEKLLAESRLLLSCSLVILNYIIAVPVLVISISVNIP